MSHLRIIAWIGVIVLFALTAWLVIHRKGRSLGPHPQITQSEFGLGTPSNQAVEPSSLPAADTRPPEQKRPANISVRDWEHLVYVQKRLVQLNGPVEFYARAIDQDAQAVAGVKLSLKLSSYNPNALKNLANYERDAVQEEQIELVSDGDGRFALSGKTGTFLRVGELGKEGYLWSIWADLELQAFDYQTDRRSRFPPYASRSEGVVFHLWKKGVTKPTVAVTHRISMERPLDEFYLNLLTGEVPQEQKQAADIQIRLVPLTPDDPAHKYEWRIELVALNGGILATTDAYPYEAPDGNFPMIYSFEFKPHSRGPVSEGWRRNFYFAGRSGRIFAGLTVEFIRAPLAFKFGGFVNPNGSRDLEPDPSKQITDPEEIRRLDEETARGLKP